MLNTIIFTLSAVNIILCMCITYNENMKNVKNFLSCIIKYKECYKFMIISHIILEIG